MHVLRKRPGFDWEEIEIEGTVASMQEEVGGCFRLAQFATDVGVIYNPAAESMGFQYNRRFLGTTFFGTFLLVGIVGDAPADLILDPKTRELVMG